MVRPGNGSWVVAHSGSCGGMGKCGSSGLACGFVAQQGVRGGGREKAAEEEKKGGHGRSQAFDTEITNEKEVCEQDQPTAA